MYRKVINKVTKYFIDLNKAEIVTIINALSSIKNEDNKLKIQDLITKLNKYLGKIAS